MGYIEANLLAGERVIHRATLHKVIFVWPTILFLMACVTVAGSGAAAAFFFLLAAVTTAYSYIRYKASEFGVTNKRVLAKVGLISRRSIEILLTKVEGIGVNQGIMGRILGYGTIVITGTGGTKEPFGLISAPFDFCKRVQE